MENQNHSAYEEPSLKIVSWNINGIRTVKNLKSLLDSFDADIICFQETKVSRDMIDEPTALVDGYNAFFSFSRAKSGYSGVATYCKEQSTPVKAEEGLSGTLQSPQQPDVIACYGDIEEEFTPQELKRLDAEGRAVITQHKILKRNGKEAVITIFNVYCPRADPDRSDRLEYKLRFYRLLEMRVSAVRCSGSHVVVVGDVNTSHHQIDRCENVPQDEFEGNQGRQWLNSFISDVKNLDCVHAVESHDNCFKIIDSFRYFHPNQLNAFTCWNTMMNARATNYGSRIDYVLVDCSLLQEMADSLILSDVMGSDHCPIIGLFKVNTIKAAKCPFACIKNFPEFVGVQQKLSSFLLKKSSMKRAIDLDDKAVKRACPESDFHSNEKDCEVNKATKMTQKKVQRDIASFFSRQASVPGKQNCENNISCEEDLLPISEKVRTVSSSPLGTAACAIPASGKMEKSNVAALVWRSMLTGPRPPPLCKGHKEPCVERTVKKKGANFNKKFFCCARGEGSRTDLNARCDHFEWAVKK